MHPREQQPAAFRLVAADELGLLKLIEVPAGPKWGEADVVAKWGTPDRKNSISALRSISSSQGPGTPSLLAVGRVGGGVQVLDGATGEQVAAWHASAEQQQQQQQEPGSSSNSAKSRVVGLHFLGAMASGIQSAVAAAASTGLQVLSISGGGRVSMHKAAGAGAAWDQTSGFQAASSVACTAVTSDGNVLAVGGEGCQLSLWDLGAQSRAWQAKGAKPNSIGLVDLAYVTAATFVSNYTKRKTDSTGGEGGCSVGRRIVVVGNTSHKLLLYDTSAGRRPQLEVAWRDARITALEADDAGQLVWAANGTGQIEAFDLRAGRMSGTLKGSGGSVRCLALHPGAELLIASAGLDRFVRVHNTASRANLGRAYMKQQLTAVAWLPPMLPAASAAAGQQAAGVELPDDANGSGSGEDEEEIIDHQEDEGDEEDEGDSDEDEESSDDDNGGKGRLQQRQQQRRSHAGNGGRGGKRKGHGSARGGGAGGRHKQISKKRKH